MTIPVYSIVIPNLHSHRIGDVLEALCRQEGVNRSIYEILVGCGLCERVRYADKEGGAGRGWPPG